MKPRFYHLSVKGSDYTIRQTDHYLEAGEIDSPSVIYANLTSHAMAYRFASEHAARRRLLRYNVHTILSLSEGSGATATVSSKEGAVQ